MGILLVAVLNLPAPVSSRVKTWLREGVAPLQRVVAGATDRASRAVDAVRGIGGLVTENQKLSEEMVRLRSEVQTLRALEAENIVLRGQLRFAQTATKRHIPAEIIARDISGWWRTVRLGKGREDGVRANMAVVSSEGLVGKTVEASPHTSDVLLLSDPGCRVSTKISRTGLFGVLSGQGSGARDQAVCVMDLINKDTPVRAGDEVVTSGLGGVFPKGLLVGYVDRVEVDSSGLYQRALVVPRADLGGLSYVFVVAEGRAGEDEGPGGPDL
jgi:rod shape-determining protein MreC